MASGERFAFYSAELGSSLTLTQHSGATYSPNTAITEIDLPATLDRGKVLSPGARPQFTIPTADLATLLGTVDLLDGVAISDDIKVAAQERADDGGFEAASGSNHRVYQAKKGFAYVESINAQAADDGNQQPAEASVIVIPKWNGTDELVDSLDNQAINGITAPAFVSAFYLGKVIHNSTEIKGIESVRINTGIVYQGAPSSPGGYIEKGSVVDRKFTIELGIKKGDEFATMPVGGDRINTSFDVYLQKSDPTNTDGAGRLAYATTSHIKISMTAGLIKKDEASAQGKDDVLDRYMVLPEGKPTISIASAIPT